MHYRTAELTDIPKIVKLYKTVAKTPGLLARNEDEMTEEYVSNFVKKSLDHGLIIVGSEENNPDELIAEIHGYRPGLANFNHVLGDVTFLVHPDHQGKKIGRTLLMIFLDEIVNNYTNIGKVELVTGESNLKAISLYQSVGFMIEGRMEMRFRKPDGMFEADIPMGWVNPGFEFDGEIPRLQ
ncbi:MAG TPA: N-acetyltransferase [Cyclobacteriaceae bacterium]|nr:N-acetyltransferase [Cyclobacteriaceae bacterium]